MSGYVERVKKDEIEQARRDLDDLDKRWANWGISEFNEMTGGKNINDVSLRNLIALQHSSADNQERFYSFGRFLGDIQGLIMEWDLVDLDENCTVGDALTALKRKAKTL